MSSYLENIRRAEIDRVQQHFKDVSRVLELGGGSGFQAKLLSALGHRVYSYDIDPPPRGHFPVAKYDGINIPLEKASVDIVFSSNTLEHVVHLDKLLDEMHRVLDDAGIAIHLVPSAAWRFWGSIAHYIYLLKSIIVKLLTRNKSNAPPVKLKNKYSTAEIIRRILYSVPHGTSKSVFSEWLAFRKNHWEKIFEKSGFEITEATSSNLFHTGYGIMPALSIKARTRLAKILGSSTHIFVLKKRN